MIKKEIYEDLFMIQTPPVDKKFKYPCLCPTSWCNITCVKSAVFPNVHNRPSAIITEERFF